MDKEGNVTIYPTTKNAHVRQQMFYMEFAVLRITNDTLTEYYGIDKKNKVYYPSLANKESVRQTYGGNFGSLYVNETAKNIDIPVSALSMGGTFTDGAAMKTYTKASITVYKVDGTKVGAAVELTDDYGSKTSVKREQTWAFDGYRPAMVVKPDTAAVLTEGTVDKPYTFTVGIQLSQKAADSNYIQYGIKSTESNLWGTPFVVLPAYGFAYAWHSQTLYSFSGMGGGYIAGQDMSLKVYFSRYYRHAQNEELSDYIRNDIRNYFISLTGLTTDEYNKLNGAAAFAKVPVAFDDLGPTELAKIEGFQKRLDALYPSWKEKEDVARAVDALNRIITVAADELTSQAAYANLTAQLFTNVEAAFTTNASGAKTIEETKAYYDSADFQALLATAKRNYSSLTAGQKALYDEGYPKSGAAYIPQFAFAKKTTAYIETAINLALEIAALSDKVSESNKDKIYTLKSGTTTVNGGALYKYNNLSAAGKALVSNAIKHKLDLLANVVDLLNMKATTVAATTANITTAKGMIQAANGGTYPAYEYAQVDHTAATFAVAQLYFKKDGTVYTPVAEPTQAEFDNDEYYQISKTPDENSNADVKYVAASFKDVKNDDRTTTWGIDAHFNALLEQAKANDKATADKAAADRVANMAKTVTLAEAIKAAAPGLPSAKEVKTDGLGSLKATYDGLMSYNATLSKTGKVDELIRLYKDLGLTTVNTNLNDLSAANLAKIVEVLSAVTGMYKKTTDTAIAEGKAYFTKGATDANGVTAYAEVDNPVVADIATYYELEAAIGNFSGKNEDGILEDLFDLPDALDKYAASLVEDMIDALPAVKNVEVSDEKAVDAANTAYGKLTAAQKAYVTNYGEIANLKNAIAALKVEAAIDPVADKIDDLPTAAKVALEDEAAIKDARKAYNALSATNKTEFNTKYAAELTKLIACEGALTALIDADVAANEAYKAAVKAFDETELTGIVNKDTYAASKALVQAFEALSGHALEYFKNPAKYAGANAALELYAKLRATVAAYEAYTTPAE